MYAITLTAMAIWFNVLWQYAARGMRSLHAAADRREVSGIRYSSWRARGFTWEACARVHDAVYRELAAAGT